MLTDSFDPRTPAKINPAPSPDALPVDACILTFSRKIADYVLAAYPCRQIGWSRSACGDTPIYCLDRAGKRFAFFLSYIGAPACTAMIEETRAVFRTEKYVLFGGAGCLDKEIARGKVMVPTAAYRDEGTSYHYAPAADYIDLPGARAVAAFCEESGLPYARGKTGATDAVFRETEGTFAARRWSAPACRRGAPSVGCSSTPSSPAATCSTRPSGMRAWPPAR